MAASHQFLIIAILAITLPSLAMAKEHIVGDDKGWTLDFNYTQWANDKVFRVGDTLVFKYNPQNHNVYKVDGAGFRNCTVPSQNEALTTGNDVIPLNSTGNKWYICGVANHCAEHGQKLVINVVSKDASASAACISSAMPQLYAVVIAASMLLIMF